MTDENIDVWSERYCPGCGHRIFRIDAFVCAWCVRLLLPAVANLARNLATAGCLAERHDDIAERMVRALYLYPHYRVDSRGPAGCIVDVLRTVAPRVADDLTDLGADATYQLHWGER